VNLHAHQGTRRGVPGARHRGLTLALGPSPPPAPPERLPVGLALERLTVDDDREGGSPPALTPSPRDDPSRAADPRRAAARPEDPSQDRPRWSFVPGEELVPGVRAWSRLGTGRHCETWIAWCLRRWSPLVVKLARPDRLDGRARAVLAREADRVRPLVHPGIQRLLDARLDGERPHLLFEYVEGPSVDALLERGALAAGDTVRLGLQVASLLHYLHGEGIVHLDVKPGNLVVRDGRVVLLDFDLALGLGETAPGGRACGSPPYMAPEQVRCAPAAPAMDVFALGATLYEAATGATAFPAPSRARAVEYPQLDGPAAPVRSRNPAVPERLAHAIHALLHRDARRRPATARAAMALLAGCLPAGEPPLWPAWVGRHLPAARGEPRRPGLTPARGGDDLRVRRLSNPRARCPTPAPSAPSSTTGTSTSPAAPRTSLRARSRRSRTLPTTPPPGSRPARS
jgi:serine/threonine protein kinase